MPFAGQLAHAHKMAEIEAEPPSSAPVEAVEAVDHGAGFDAYGPLPVYDDALLERGKNGRPKKPVKPDDTERNITIEKMSAEVKKCSDRIAEIKALELARRTRGVNPEVAEHRSRKGELSREWNAVLVRSAWHACPTWPRSHPFLNIAEAKDADPGGIPAGTD